MNSNVNMNGRVPGKAWVNAKANVLKLLLEKGITEDMVTSIDLTMEYADMDTDGNTPGNSMWTFWAYAEKHDPKTFRAP